MVTKDKMNVDKGHMVMRYCIAVLTESEGREMYDGRCQVRYDLIGTDDIDG